MTYYLLGVEGVGKLFVVVERESEWRVREDESAVDRGSKSRFDWRFVVVVDLELVVVVTRHLCYLLSG